MKCILNSWRTKNKKVVPHLKNEETRMIDKKREYQKRFHNLDYLKKNQPLIRIFAMISIEYWTIMVQIKMMSYFKDPSTEIN